MSGTMEEWNCGRKFVRPSPKSKSHGRSEPTHVLYVANCGPALGISLERIASVFGSFGRVVHVQLADDSGARVIVVFSSTTPATAALNAFKGVPCSHLHNRILHINYSVPCSSPPVIDPLPVSCNATKLGIPGLHLIHEFVSTDEEQELIRAVDSHPWKTLSKRRVQHYGYEFCYHKRDVDPTQSLGQLPSFVSTVLKRVAMFPGVGSTEYSILDQLTVCEIGQRIPTGSGDIPTYRYTFCIW